MKSFVVCLLLVFGACTQPALAGVLFRFEDLREIDSVSHIFAVDIVARSLGSDAPSKLAGGSVIVQFADASGLSFESNVAPEPDPPLSPSPNSPPPPVLPAKFAPGLYTPAIINGNELAASVVDFSNPITYDNGLNLFTIRFKADPLATPTLSSLKLLRREDATFGILLSPVFFYFPNNDINEQMAFGEAQLNDTATVPEPLSIFSFAAVGALMIRSRRGKAKKG